MSLQKKNFLELYEHLIKLLDSLDLKDSREMALLLYQVKRGLPKDDDASYHTRIQNFFEYFLFEFRLGETLLTPFETFLSSIPFKTPDRRIWVQFRQNLESIFELQSSISGQIIQIYDLINQQPFRVQLANPQLSLKFTKRQSLFIGRLIYYEGTHYLTPSLVIQPFSILNLIKNIIAKHRKTQPKIPVRYTHPEPLKERYQKRFQDFSVFPSKEDYEKKKISDKLTLTLQMRNFGLHYQEDDIFLKLNQNYTFDPFLMESPISEDESVLNYLMRCELKYRLYKHIKPEVIYARDYLLPSGLA